MTPRDQKLALLLIGVMALTVGLLGGYFFVFDPIMKNRTAESALQGEIADLQDKATQQAAKLKRLKVQQAQSLPADQTVAKQEYFVALEGLVERAIRAAEEAGVPRGEIKSTINAKVVDNTARGVPEFSKGKPMYTKLAYTVVVKKADMWVVRDILKGYYELDLLHQITHFSLKKDDDNAKGPVKRNDLTLEFTTEAVIVEGGPANGPQYRRTLVAVPSAFGAAGGGALQQVLEGSTELGRGASARPAQPVLATKPRDYSLIVLKDPFNGPLPPPPAFKLSPIKDVVVKQDDAKPTTVKLPVSGEGATGTRFRAIVSGALFPEGELKVDNRWQTLELPKTSAGEGTAKVEVIATSADGKVAQTTFNVSVEPKKAEEIVETTDKRDDVSGAIILTMLTIRHENGTASAAIRDSANRQRYEIEIEGKKVTVAKFYFIKDKKKEDDTDKNGVLLISDDNSRTKRTFKVIGVDGEGLIVEDLKPDGEAPKAEAPKPKGGPGGWPPRGGAPKQGPASPVAALGGNMASGAGVVAGAPKLYRWTVGQSLASLDKPLSDAEAARVLKQAAATGPMLEISAANN